MSVSTWDEIVDSPKCLCTALGGFEALDTRSTFSQKRRFAVPLSLGIFSLCLGGYVSASSNMEVDSMVEKCNRGLLAHRELHTPPPSYYGTFRVGCRSSDNVSDPFTKWGDSGKDRKEDSENP